MPPVSYFVTQDLPEGKKRPFPDIGFVLQHLGDSLSVRVRVTLAIRLNGKRLVAPKHYYGGTKLWRLNPRMQHFGHFYAPVKTVKPTQRLEIEAGISLIDVYGRLHDLLPVGWVYMPQENSWYFEP